MLHGVLLEVVHVNMLCIILQDELMIELVSLL